MKNIKLGIVCLVVLFLGSVFIQFGYNMLFVKPYEPKLAKGGDGKLTQMLYESEQLEDSYFSKVPISYSVYDALSDLIFEIDC